MQMCHHSVMYSAPEMWDQHSILSQKAEFITHLRKGELHLLGTVPPNKEDCWSYIGVLRIVEFKYWWTLRGKNELIQLEKLVVRGGDVVDGMNCRDMFIEVRLLIGWLEKVGGCHWLAGFQKHVQWGELLLIEQTNLIQFWLLLFTMTIKQSISS